MLSGVVSVIEWEAEQPEALDHAEAIFTNLVTSLLGSYLGDLERTNPPAAEHIVNLLTSLDAAALQRVVLAPETSCRLLWEHNGACDRREFSEYLKDVLEVELAREAAALPKSSATSPTAAAPGARWSALGDACIQATGHLMVVQPPVGGLVVDSDSPSAVCFNPGLSYIDMQLKHYEDAAEKQLALGKAESAMLAIDAVSPTIASFTRRFTRVANLLVDEKAGFSSGSTNEHIGRSIFWNAHRDSVDTGTLAEAFVHEATHALLSMHEVNESWFLSKEWLSFETRVESPWTGAKLRIEPFLQACFVWFGLANFWATASRGSYFTAQRAERGLTQARKGFLRGQLLDRIVPYRPFVAPELIEIIQNMQERMLSA